MMKRCAFLLPPTLLFVCASVFAQANTDPQIDLQLADIDDLRAVGRTGTFPNGLNACAFETTACNEGTKEINWHAAMQAQHPFISFLLVRESNGRLEQISDRSYVKHGFFALSNNLCHTCSPTDGSMLGIGCSDTYAVGNNSDNYWLGPPEEINPWLGQWDPVCSHFDRGEPEVSPPLDCNGQRSFTQTQAGNLGPIGHRIQVKDADFNVAGASYWFQGMYIIETEGDRSRKDNLASRAFIPSWTGSNWNLIETGGQVHGSVLGRWSGATISTGVNGNDDGRFYVGVKVTGPVDGLYHYEYAVHNVDNNRGGGGLRIPVCASARVLNLGFGDIDDDAGNDWSVAVQGAEIAYSGPANALRWNTIYNFWFDSDAAPGSASLAIDEADAGPGLASVSVTASAPTQLFNVFLGPGCSLGTPPQLFVTGTPPRATLGNTSFAMVSTGNVPLQPVYLRYTTVSGSFQQLGCTRYLGPGPGQSFLAAVLNSNASGTVTFNAAIPNNVSLEGKNILLQTMSRHPGGGAFHTNFDLSDGLRVRVGNNIAVCP